MPVPFCINSKIRDYSWYLLFNIILLQIKLITKIGKCLRNNCLVQIDRILKHDIYLDFSLKKTKSFLCKKIFIHFIEYILECWISNSLLLLSLCLVVFNAIIFNSLHISKRCLVKADSCHVRFSIISFCLTRYNVSIGTIAILTNLSACHCRCLSLLENDIGEI